MRYGVRMKTRSLIAGAAVLALALPLACNAQSAPDSNTTGAQAGARHHRGGMMQRFMTGITLSDAQKQQLQKLRDDFRTAHPQGQRPDRDAMKQLRQSMLDVLTPDQRTQFDANVKAFRAQHPRGSRHDGQGGAGGPFAPNPTPTPNP